MKRSLNNPDGDALEAYQIKEYPFDPVKRAQAAEKLVMQGNKRAYYRTRYSPRFFCL